MFWTQLYTSRSQAYPLEAAQLEEMRQAASAVSEAFTEERIKSVVGEIMALLSAGR